MAHHNIKGTFQHKAEFLFGSMPPFRINKLLNLGNLQISATLMLWLNQKHSVNLYISKRHHYRDPSPTDLCNSMAPVSELMKKGRVSALSGEAGARL